MCPVQYCARGNTINTTIKTSECKNSIFEDNKRYDLGWRDAPSVSSENSALACWSDHHK